MNNDPIAMFIVCFVLLCCFWGWPGDRAKKERQQQEEKARLELLWQQSTNAVNSTNGVAR